MNSNPRRRTRMMVVGAVVLCTAFLFVVQSNDVAAQEDRQLSQEEAQEKKEALEQELRELEEEIARHRENVEKRRQEARTFERDIAIIDGEIRTIELQIRAATVAIDNATAELQSIRRQIADINGQIFRSREQIGALLRQMYRSDSTTVLEMLLRDETLSDFFTSVDSLQTIQFGLQNKLAAVRQLREELGHRTVDLEDAIEGQSHLLTLQQTQRQAVAAKRTERQTLLDETRGEEALFQKIVDRTVRDANAVRNQLFILEGGGSGPLTFEQAYEFAKEASRFTGIRIAFLMSVIKQESNFGANVGQCFWRQDVGGRPVMHPTRDQPVFAQITEELGINPNEQPVSCPGFRSGQRYGWGGAMGFAQFIPSTWMAYKEAVGELTGRVPPSPWRAGDAFTASAVKLVRAGANNGSRGEFLAAMRYFSGGSWAAWEESVYARPILQRAAEIEQQIAIIEQ